MRRFMEADPAGDEEKDRFLETALRIAEWGGIQNLSSLRRMGRKAPHEPGGHAELLNPQQADTCGLSEIRHMGTSYSKIYSAMIEGFPICDSRTACALASMAEIFRIERGLPAIPGVLRLWLPRARTSRLAGMRNRYGFPGINDASRRRYAESNLKMAWILGVRANLDGQFKEEFRNRNHRIMALQSALFMPGYT